MTSVLWNQHMLPMYLNGLQAAIPLKHRELHMDHSEVHPTQCSVMICHEGHVHFQVAMLAPTSVVTVLALYAYTLALVLDTRKACPKRPNKRRARQCVAAVERVLAELDPSGAARGAYMQNLGILGEWIKESIREETVISSEMEDVDAMPEPTLVLQGLFGPVRTGDA